MSEEKIVWSGTPSQVLNLGIFIICLLTFFLMIPIFIALWKWLEIKCTKYEVTTERVKVKTGIFNVKVDYLELYRVNDMVFEQPFLLRIFSLGNLKLITSDSSTPMLILKAIPASEEIISNIRRCIEVQRDKKRARVVDFT